MEEYESHNDFVDLDFVRTRSVSKQDKIMEFWKYLDNQDILKPYEPMSTINNTEDEKTDVLSLSASSSVSSPSIKMPVTKPKIKKGIKDKNKDPNSCKLEKYFREDLQYADTVQMTYEEIKAEIEDYHKRLRDCNCKDKTCSCAKKSHKQKN